MTNSKKKGNAWENKLAGWLHSHGFKAWKDGASGGGNREKGDIGNNIDMTIESKAAKTIALPDWWRQVTRSALMHHNAPVLFIHQDGMPDLEWMVVMHSEDWVELVKAAKQASVVISGVPSNDREKTYALDQLRIALARVTKVIS